MRSPWPVVFAELRQAFTKIPVTVWSNPFQLSLLSFSQSTRSSSCLCCRCVVLSKPSAAGNADAPLPLTRLVSDQRAGVPFGLTALCKKDVWSWGRSASETFAAFPWTTSSLCTDLFLVSSWSLDNKIPIAGKTELGSAFTWSVRTPCDRFSDVCLQSFSMGTKRWISLKSLCTK